MCLYLPKKYKPNVTTEPLTVFKLVSKFYFTNKLEIIKERDEVVPLFIKSWIYEKDNPYKTDITINSTLIMGAFDEKEMELIREYKHKQFGGQNYPLYVITQGFHFAFNKERLIKPYYSEKLDSPNVFIARFELPEGTTYYKGIDEELGAANKIIYRDIVFEDQYF